MDHRLPGAATALRRFPKQAAALAMFERLGLPEAKMAAAVLKLSAASPEVARDWDAFLKAAVEPIPPTPRPIPKPVASAATVKPPAPGWFANGMPVPPKPDPAVAQRVCNAQHGADGVAALRANEAYKGRAYGQTGGS